MAKRTPKPKGPSLFALPIANEEKLAHYPSGPVPDPLPDDIYGPYAGKISAGRPFRQPLLTATDAAQFAPGLELNFTDDLKASSIYAWFSGRLNWAPKKDTGDQDSGGLPMRASLRLVAEVRSMAALGLSPKTFETPPAVTIYENMDATDVKQTLGALIRKAYDLAATNPSNLWHPVLSDQFSPDQTVKKFIDTKRDEAVKEQPPRTPEEGITSAIEEICNSFVAPGSKFSGLRVLGGDLLGHAALVPGNTDPAKARQIVFHSLDKGLQFIHPLFYFHLYAKATSGIIQLTLLGPQHPLYGLYPELNGASRPPARIPTNDAAKQIRIPAGWWGEDHSMDQATIAKWRYVTSPNPTKPDDLKFDTTPHQAALDVTPENANQVGTFWKTYGADIAAICREFSVPCELAMAICGHETQWKTGKPGQYRIEPLTGAQRAKVRAAGLELQWDYTAGIPAVTDPPVKATFTPATNVFKSSVSSTLEVQLLSKQTLAKNKLVPKKGKKEDTHRYVVVGDAYRPVVLENSGTDKTKPNFYKIKVPDERISAQATVSAQGTVTVDGGFGPLKRTATLRALRAQLTSNKQTPKATLPYPVTVTVLLDGDPTPNPLTLTVAAGVKNDGELNQTLVVFEGQTVTFQVKGGAANTNPPDVTVDVEVHLAPVNGDLVVVVMGTNTGASDVNTIPDPWTPDEFVRNNREGKALTWGQLATAIDALGGHAISPGFMQTLISTAVGTLDKIKGISPDIFTRLNIRVPPTKPSDFIIANPTDGPGWLLVPKNSFFAGIGKVLVGYGGQTPGWDLPRACSNYNDDGNETQSRYGVVVNDYGSETDPGYIDDAAARFGLVVDHFASLPADSPVPTVRLKK